MRADDKVGAAINKAYGNMKQVAEEGKDALGR